MLSRLEWIATIPHILPPFPVLPVPGDALLICLLGLGDEKCAAPLLCSTARGRFLLLPGKPPSFCSKRTTLRRVQAVLRPDPTGLYQHTPVELEGVYRGAADRRPSDDARGGRTPAKVLIPAIRAWIEEGDDPSGARIRRFRARLLVTVALGAATTEVFEIVQSAARTRQDVIDGEFLAGKGRLRVAVLTKPARPAQNGLTQRRRKTPHRTRGRASARRSMISSDRAINASSSSCSAGVREVVSLPASNSSNRA